MEYDWGFSFGALLAAVILRDGLQTGKKYKSLVLIASGGLLLGNLYFIDLVQQGVELYRLGGWLIIWVLGLPLFISGIRAWAKARRYQSET